MALLFMEGFEKYGLSNTVGAYVQALLQAGEWTSSANTHQIVAPLSSAGQALLLTGGNSVSKTLPGNYARLIGGFRFNSTLNGNAALVLRDGTDQVTITINNGTGNISVRNGGYNGTGLGTSSVAVAANSTHYLEFDISISNTGAYQVWLDGVSVLSGTGDTNVSANNYVNNFYFGNAGIGNWTIDDIYIFDATGTTNNAPLLTSPRVETQFPSADNVVQFASGAGILGSNLMRTTANANTSGNFMFLRAFTPAANCTLNSISLLAINGSASTANCRAVIYTDSAGVPTTLMSSGSTVVGVIVNIPTVLPLTTPQSLVAGVQYWLGFMCDIGLVTIISSQDNDSTGRSVAATFASGAPSTCPATSAGQPTWPIWGNVTVTANNWYQVSRRPPAGVNSYVFGGDTVGTTWNPADQTNMSLTGGNLIATVSTAPGGAKSIFSSTTGKYYFEIRPTTVSNTTLGFARASATFANLLPMGLGGGDGTGAVILTSGGIIYVNNSITLNMGAGIVNNDLIQIAVDLTANLIWFRINAGNWNNSGTANPATGVGGIGISSVNTAALYAYCGGYGVASYTANFGASGFVYSAPAGFTAGWGATTSAVGKEDLYNYPPLSTVASAIYAVAVKANVAKSDTGTRTVSMRMKSGATDSGGSLTGQAPGTTFGWLTSNFPLDPNGDIAWTTTNLNAAQSGFRIDS